MHVCVCHPLEEQSPNVTEHGLMWGFLCLQDANSQDKGVQEVHHVVNGTGMEAVLSLQPQHLRRGEREGREGGGGRERIGEGGRG